MVFGHFYIKPVAFSTCSVEEKEHVPLSLSLSPLSSALLSSPLLSSPELDRVGQSCNQRQRKPKVKVAPSLQ